MRALARPPFAPAVRTDIVPRPLVRDVVDRFVDDLLAVARPPFFPAAFFCAVVPARPPFAPAWRTVGLRRLVVLRVLVLRAAVLRAVVLRAELVLRVPVLRAVVFFRDEAVLRVDEVLRLVVFLRDELPPEREDDPPERDDEEREDEDDDFEDEPDFVSPFAARSLLTVRAAISFARFVERPCFFSESLMCSYWRSRFELHASGMREPPCEFPGRKTHAQNTQGVFARQKRQKLIERLVLNVVLGRVVVRELVHLVEPLAVGVVDLHERLPLVRERVLREDRLDGAFRLAGTAVDALFGVDDEDPIGLVDAVDGTDVDARFVFDVDAGLGDDVRHGGLLYRR